MSSPNPLQRLRDLDGSSPGFPNQLTDILLREGWANRAKDLADDDLGELVEYLDGVSVQIVSVHFLLNTIVGPQHPRLHKPRFLPLFV